MSSTDLRVIANDVSATSYADPRTPDAVDYELRRATSAVLRPNWNSDLTRLLGYDMVEGADDDGIDRARRLVEESLAPSDERHVHRELSRLRLVVAHRLTDAGELAAVVRIYREELVQFPPDVVSEACRRGKWKFWPALTELVEHCEQLLGRRRAMLKALPAKSERSVSDPGRPPNSPDDLAAVEESVRRCRAILAGTVAALRM